MNTDIGCVFFEWIDLTERAAIGELLALLFLPLALLGLLKILYGDIQKFYWLSIAMAGIIFSHLLSALIFAIFIFLFLLMNLFQLLADKKKILALLKASVLTFFLCVGFLAPIVEQTASQKFNFQVNPYVNIADTGSTITEYFRMALRNSSTSNLGILIFLLLVFLIFRIRTISLLSKKMIGLSCCFLFFATNSFPYKLFEKTPINSIQFPWRFFTIITLLVCWIFADNLTHFFKKDKWTNILSIGSLGIAGTLLIFHNLFIFEPGDYVSKNNMDSRFQGAIGGGIEYFPADMDIDELLGMTDTVLASKGVVIDNVVFDYGKISLSYDTGELKGEKQIVFPLTYYKGYQAVTQNEQLDVYDSPELHGLSAVNVKGKGNLEIYYQWTPIQKWSFVISMISWSALVGKLVIDRSLMFTD